MRILMNMIRMMNDMLMHICEYEYEKRYNELGKDEFITIQKYFLLQFQFHFPYQFLFQFHDL